MPIDNTRQHATAIYNIAMVSAKLDSFAETLKSKAASGSRPNRLYFRGLATKISTELQGLIRYEEQFRLTSDPHFRQGVQWGVDVAKEANDYGFLANNDPKQWQIDLLNFAGELHKASAAIGLVSRRLSTPLSPGKSRKSRERLLG